MRGIQKTMHRSSDSASNQSTPPGLDTHFDPAYSTSVSQNVIELLARHYFRAELVGFDTVPEPPSSGAPLIYAGNHSGMSFPWDAIVFISKLYALADYDFSRAARPLTAPALSARRIMSPFFLPNFWKRAGGVDATMRNFEGLASRGREGGVLIYPEGIGGIGKGFDKRYHMQRFSNSFVRMAIKHRSDIVPVLTVNGEYINPLGYKSDFLNRFVQKLGLPFVPVGPLTTLVSLQPWSFYFGLPAKLTYVRGRRIRIDQLTDQPLEKLKVKELRHICSQVQKSMQEDLDEAVATHGRDPYHLDELAETLLAARDRLFYILPSGWPVLFAEHDRLFQQRANPAEPVRMSHGNFDFLHALSKNLESLAYHVPFAGWPLLFLAHAIEDYESEAKAGTDAMRKNQEAHESRSSS